MSKTGSLLGGGGMATGQSAAPMETGVSIEQFVVGALLGQEKHHWQHNGMLNITAWPDIQSKLFGGEIAALSSTLLGAGATGAQLDALAPRNVISAFLYACQAARLLSREASQPAGAKLESGQRSKQDADGVMSALKRWLGF